jgi:predicted nucleic acid-binding protein
LRTLFDSTILIAHLRGDDRATALLLDASREGALASVVSRAEIEGGMAADYLIAATAAEAGATLATLNVKHFPMVEGLRPPW